MSNLKALLTQKNDLLAQIRRIEESCEGIENEANAHRIAELNEQQMKLSATKRDLQGKLSALESELNGVSSKIQELSGTGVDKILEAIKKQRWFWFKDKPKVLFDRDTALLWANLDYFPYKKNNNSSRYGCDEMAGLMKSINDVGINDYNNWRIPSLDELWKLIIKKDFPFKQGSGLRIKDDCCWCVFHNNTFMNRCLDHTSSPTDGMGKGSVNALPCCDILQPTDYENNISPSNNFYSEKEKLQFTLNIFVTNNLIPLFNDESITHLYRQIYVEKPALIAQLSTLQSEINALQEVTLLSSTFNYHGLLTGYDIPAINESIIKYHEAVTSLADTFLAKVRELENEKKATIREFDAAGLKLGVPYRERDELTAAENEALEMRRNFLARHLSLNMEGVKEQIRSVKRQGEDLAARIASINRGKNSLEKLGQLKNEERADFALIAENLAYIVREALKKIEFYEAHHDFALGLIETWAAWEDSCLDFKTNQQDAFLTACQEHGIPAEQSKGYFADWATKRLAAEEAFLPLAEYILQGHLLHGKKGEPTFAEKVLQLLRAYRETLDGFYREEVWRIHVEIEADAFGRRAKLEIEKAFYWRIAHWMKGDWAGLLFSLADREERLFLARWLHPMLDLPMQAVLDFVRSHEELSLSLQATSDLLAVQEQDVRPLLAKQEEYAKGLDERGHKWENIISQAAEEWASAPAPRMMGAEESDEPESDQMTIMKGED